MKQRFSYIMDMLNSSNWLADLWCSVKTQKKHKKRQREKKEKQKSNKKTKKKKNKEKRNKQKERKRKKKECWTVELLMLTGWFVIFCKKQKKNNKIIEK